MSEITPRRPAVMGGGGCGAAPGWPSTGDRPSRRAIPRTPGPRISFRYSSSIASCRLRPRRPNSTPLAESRGVATSPGTRPSKAVAGASAPSPGTRRHSRWCRLHNRRGDFFRWRAGCPLAGLASDGPSPAAASAVSVAAGGAVGGSGRAAGASVGGRQRRSGPCHQPGGGCPLCQLRSALNHHVEVWSTIATSDATAGVVPVPPARGPVCCDPPSPRTLTGGRPRRSDGASAVAHSEQSPRPP